MVPWEVDRCGCYVGGGERRSVGFRRNAMSGCGFRRDVVWGAWGLEWAQCIRV